MKQFMISFYLYTRTSCLQQIYRDCAFCPRITEHVGKNKIHFNLKKNTRLN